MSTIEVSKTVNSLPDMNTILQSIKTINRAVPAVKDCAYSYFADLVKLGSTIAQNMNEQITDALTNLPVSLENLKSADAFAKNIAKINEAEKAGKIDAETAAKGRLQLEQKLNDGLSSTIKNFNDAATSLSDSTKRLHTNSQTFEVRLKDANSTETANHIRAKSDLERESARVDTLQKRYEKLCEAVDEKRGGPVDELLSIIPDEKEISSLMDVGAADAAAGPEAAAAKKAVEVAVAQLKKVLEAVNKTIEFTQLAEMRDEVFAALDAQLKVKKAALDRLEATETTINQLGIVEAASIAMEAVAVEVDKIVDTLYDFIKTIEELDGKALTEDSMSKLYNSMNSYLDKVRKANNEVILG